MAFSINIPRLARLTFIRTPAEAAAAVDAIRIDRMLSGRGGLLNRMAAGKLAPFLSADGPHWPAFMSRFDPDRVEGRESLEQKLKDLDGILAALASEIAELAAHVRDRNTAHSPGVLVQQAVGRVFFPDYAATEDSYSAALTVSGWLSAGPIKSLYLRCSGKFQAALDQMIARSRGNLYCAHGTTLAMHNIVDSVKLMRNLARSGSTLKELTPEQAAAKVLRAPRRVIREAQDSAALPDARIRDRALVLISVEAARRGGSDPGAFFVGHWNQCPAHAFVPALLGRIWLAARALE
jgi:hypothetical protein